MRMMVIWLVMRMILLVMINEAAREARAKVMMMMLLMRMMVNWLVMRMILLVVITEAAREARAKVIGLKIRLLGFFKY